MILRPHQYVLCEFSCTIIILYLQKADLSFEDREVVFTNWFSASQLLVGLEMSHFKSSILLFLFIYFF